MTSGIACLVVYLEANFPYHTNSYLTGGREIWEEWQSLFLYAYLHLLLSYTEKGRGYQEKKILP